MDVRLTHIGGPTVLIEVGGWRLLTDPTFDSPGRSYAFGWGTGSVKTEGPALSQADIGPIDAALLTHDHHDDNLDAAGRELLARAPIVITTAPGARRLGGTTRGLKPWDSTRLTSSSRPDVEVVATPCRHGPPLSRPLAGAVIGFAIGWESQRDGVLWISGDTVLFRGLREVAERLRVDVALIHLGGVRFPVTGPLRYTMVASDVTRLSELVKPKTWIPIHYEGWAHFHEGREQIEEELARGPSNVRDSVRWLPPGISVDLSVSAALNQLARSPVA